MVFIFFSSAAPCRLSMIHSLREISRKSIRENPYFWIISANNFAVVYDSLHVHRRRYQAPATPRSCPGAARRSAMPYAMRGIRGFRVILEGRGKVCAGNVAYQKNYATGFKTMRSLMSAGNTMINIAICRKKRRRLNSGNAIS